LLKWISLGFRVFVGLAVLSVGLGLVWYMASHREKPKLKPEVFAPLLVEGMVLEPQHVERAWTGYGNARAMDSARVSPQVSGLVIDRAGWLEAGAQVDAGQKLFELDAVDFELAAKTARDTIASLEAQVSGLEVEEQRLKRRVSLAQDEQEIAGRDYERAQEAVAGGAGSKSELDRWMGAVRRAERAVIALEQQLELIPSRRADLIARIEGQRTQLKKAQEDISRATITSPIKGVVQSVSLEVGEWAQVGQVAAVIVDLSRIEVPLRVSMDGSGHIRVGDRAQVRSRLEDEIAWDGRVSRIGPDADSATRALTVYVEIEQDSLAGRVLRPGQFVVGQVLESNAAVRLVVPRRAINSGRVLVAGEVGSDEARVWPLAERIAGTIARGIASDSTPVVSDGSGGGVPEVVVEVARLEVGDLAEDLSQLVSGDVQRWLSDAGSLRVREEIRRALTEVLTPEIARWLAEMEPGEFPEGLGEELGLMRRLSVVESVPVEVIFRVDQVFEELDDRETQWVVVRARGGVDLVGRELLVSNLGQLSDGMMIQVDLGDGR
jgi:multidrug resistance efflux pump